MKKQITLVFISLLVFSYSKANKVILLPRLNSYCLQYEPTPRFPGGDKALNKFIYKNLRWPKTDADATGSVVLSFYVEKDGRLTDIKVVKSLHPDFDAEALKVMKKSPKWLPAVLNNKSIRCKYYIPIKFHLQEN
ncbi:MAG: energy transducer TonB [Sphingobacteriaceae bacterium]|nr:MAG: energy transducer TonB [Sphingobacteriaceae bacterium]